MYPQRFARATPGKAAGMSARERIADVARESLGIERLRPGQGEAVEALLEGRDTLAVMSTGYGKTAIYELGALLIDGPTIVVSPLLALQRDQIEAIEDHLPGEAAQLSSDVPEAEFEEVLEETAAGEREFVLLAPEQLAKDDVRARLAEGKPSLLVVDEAHCISEWGHDFRPEYLRLGALAKELGSPTVLALTATASPPVRREIVERLGMDDPAVIVRGFDRPNIHLAVERYSRAADKERAILEAVAEAPTPGIVYVATRAGADELATELRERGVEARHYHAGLSKGERELLHDEFDGDEIDVIVATIAFGMGIDKPNVRFVHHAEISESIDSYYQEIGRGGRDGEPAEATLFFRPEDQAVRRFFASGGAVSADEIELVAEAIERRRKSIDPVELVEETELSRTKLLSAINRLEEMGAVEVSGDGHVRKASDGPRPTEAVEDAAEASENRQAFNRSRVEMMRSYAEHTGCRRQFLLSYFGESYEPPCGNCDNCDAGHGDGADEGPFAIGSSVSHPEWGVGEVQRYDEGRVVVLFESVGYKTLDLELVAEGDLLEPA
jgi:ATP-dependent DNA helicase RecQ